MLRYNILCSAQFLGDFLNTIGEQKWKTKFLKKMAETGRTSYTALQKLAVLNSKTLKELTELNMDMVSYNIESGAELASALGAANNYKDVMSVEVKYAGEYSDKVLELGRKAADVLNESCDETIDWLESTIKGAMADAKKPVTKRTGVKKED